MPPASAPAAFSFPQRNFQAPPACKPVDKITGPHAALPLPGEREFSLPDRRIFDAPAPTLPPADYSEEGMIGTMEGVISQADARAGHGAGNPRDSTETSNKYPETPGKSIQMFQTYSQVFLAARHCLTYLDNRGSLYHQLCGNGFRTGRLPVMPHAGALHIQAGCSADSVFHQRRNTRKMGMTQSRPTASIKPLLARTN